MGYRDWQPYLLTLLAVLAGWVVFVAPAHGQGLVPLGEDELPPAGGNVRIVTGTLRGPDGPAAGVRILLDVRNMAFRRPDLTLETRSDSAGRFRFELEGFRAQRVGLDLRAHSPRYRYFNRIVEIDDVEFPYDFVIDLEAGVLTRGRVVDESGKPLPDVVISHQSMPLHNSGPDGTWEVFGLASPRDRLQFGLDGYVREALEIETPAPGIYEGFEVVLRSARAMTGVVTNRSGVAVPGAMLRLYDGTRYLTAHGDEEGRFEFRALPAGREGFRLLAHADGYLPAEKQIEDADVQRGLTVMLQPGIVLSGDVRMPSGQSAPGTRMIVTTGDRTLEALSDRTGRWRVGPFFPREEVKVFALPTTSQRSWGIADLLLRQVAGQPGVFEGDVALWPQGHMSDFRGTWDGQRIRLEREDQGISGIPSTVIYEGEWDGTTPRITGTLEVTGMDQRGTFTLNRQTRLDSGLGGVWEIREQVEASTLRAAPVQRELRTGVLPGRLHVELTLDEPLELAGRILRENGRPFLDGAVSLTDWDGTPYLRLESPISVDGSFSFPSVPRGTFTVMAHDGERETWAGPFILRGGISDAVLQAGEPPDDPIDE